LGEKRRAEGIQEKGYYASVWIGDWVKPFYAKNGTGPGKYYYT